MAKRINIPKTLPDGSENRRAFERLPMEWNVHYKLTDSDATGSGKTMDISAGGVLFTTESALPTGCEVELLIDWPVQRNNKTSLTLVLVGEVIRTGKEEAAMRIYGYELKPGNTNRRLRRPNVRSL